MHWSAVWVCGPQNIYVIFSFNTKKIFCIFFVRYWNISTFNTAAIYAYLPAEKYIFYYIYVWLDWCHLILWWTDSHWLWADKKPPLQLLLTKDELVWVRGGGASDSLKLMGQLWSIYLIRQQQQQKDTFNMWTKIILSVIMIASIHRWHWNCGKYKMAFFFSHFISLCPVFVSQQWKSIDWHFQSKVNNRLPTALCSSILTLHSFSVVDTGGINDWVVTFNNKRGGGKSKVWLCRGLLIFYLKKQTLSL